MEDPQRPEPPAPAPPVPGDAADAASAPAMKLDLVPVSRPWKIVMIAFVVVWGSLITLVNTTRRNPVAGARVATKFGMFSAPPKAQAVVVRGIPRHGAREPVVLLDPNAKGRPWRERLRDARERKYHDNVGRAVGLHQSYLGYRCRVHGADYRKVQLVSVQELGLPEKVIAERNCPPPARNAPPPRAAQ